MITEQTKKILKEAEHTSYGKAFLDALDEELAKVDTVRDCKSEGELIGRQIAVGVINRIISLIKETKVDIKSKNQYE